MIYPVIIYPTKDAIHVDDALEFLRNPPSAVFRVARLIRGAQNWAEEITHRDFVYRTRKLALDDHELRRLEIRVPTPPFMKVVSFTTYDGEDAATTIASSFYAALGDDPAMIVQRSTGWTGMGRLFKAVEIVYRSGYLVPFTAATSDTITSLGHPFSDTDAVELTFSGSATQRLPTPLTERAIYYIRDSAADTFKLALTSGGVAIDITDVGTGNHFVGVLPQAIRDAMEIRISDMFFGRSSERIGRMVSKTSVDAEKMLEPFIHDRFMFSYR